MSGKYVFSKGLKELRFLFCQTSEASAPTRHVPRAQQNETQPKPLILANCPRSFLNRAYPTMKKHNPHTPIMMREASGTEPRVFARYGTTRAQLKETEPS